MRSALAFARSAESPAKFSGRAFAVDSAVAAAATIVTLAAARTSPAGRWPGISWPMLLVVALTAAPLAVRRIFPLTAFWIIMIAVLGSGVYAGQVTYFTVGFAAYSAVAHSRFRGLALLSLPLAAVLIIGIFGGATPEFPQWSIPLILFIPIMIVGNAIHVWRRRAGDSQAQLLHLDAEHRAQTLRALGLERARIARELHDVVTHNVSVMVVQAGAARQVLAESPGQAREALLAVESTGRAAMTELRHLLGLLSAEDEPAAAPAGAADEASTEPPRPQPGLGQVQSLISRVVATGLPVDLRLTGVPRGLPPGLDLAAYRVIQEALTNVIKHAGRARTTVRIDYGAGELLLEVASEGPPIPAAVPRAAAGGEPALAGRGLLGLRERIGLYGGTLTAGPGPAGGWLLRAVIPLDQLPPVAADAIDAANLNAAGTLNATDTLNAAPGTATG